MRNDADTSKTRRIRFMDAEYNTLFSIPDGGYVTITHRCGEQVIEQCRHIDDCHTRIGARIYDIHQFAVTMKRSGSTVEPCPGPEEISGRFMDGRGENDWYRVTRRMTTGKKTIALAQKTDVPSQKSRHQWSTWMREGETSGWEWGRYFADRMEAKNDYLRLIEAAS
jgi:hypothetical protein